MMKVFGLVCVMVFAASCSSFAATADVYVGAGWNMISAPLVPITSSPDSVFADAPLGIDGNLVRWDPSTGGVSYDSGTPEDFGNVLLGDGYWLYSGSDKTMNYTGVEDGVPSTAGDRTTRTDMWISLPGDQSDSVTASPNGGGWHQIGYPFAKSMEVDSGAGTGDQVLFTDGTTVKTWSEAVTAQWVDYSLTGWDAATGGVVVQYDGAGDTTTLTPGRGYWIRTYKDNIAMILKAEYSK